MGGSAGNIAVALAQQGTHAELLTVVSDDQVGRFVLAKSRQYGVSIGYCRTQAGLCRNSLAIAETKSEDAAVVIYRNDAADLQISKRDVERVDFSKAGGLVLTGTAFSGEPSASALSFAIGAARQAGCPVIIDIDYRANAWPNPSAASLRMGPELGQADILVGNDDEFAVMGGGDRNKGLAAARSYAATGQLVLYKRGDLGCISLYQNHVIETGIFPVKVTKPYGAGDAFLGNFLNRLSLNGDVRAAVLKGSAAAAYVVARPGCASAMPDKQQLEEFILSHKMTGPNK
jgi:5-dehydro-2-deoxygluconokinase